MIDACTNEEVAGPSEISWAGSDEAPITWTTMSKRTQKKKAKARRSKANHGRKPNVGRNS